MNKSCSIEEIVEAIKKAKTIAVISHYNPDADAYGSSCALFMALRKSGKEVYCANESKLSERYRFIPGASAVSNSIRPADLALVCDCGSLARTGDTFKTELSKFPLIINIDHHISNDFFGALNYVITKSSSTSEVIFELIKFMDLIITPEIATALYVGMAGDTGSYRYSSTSSQTLRIAAELVDAGADLELISNKYWGNKTQAAVMLKAEALTKMTLHHGGRLAEVVISQEMYDLTKSTPDDTEDLVEQARDIEGVDISVLIKWDSGIWKISMRSKDKRYNVSEVASRYGGGGHIMAAAFRWKNSLEELRTKLILHLEEVLAVK